MKKYELTDITTYFNGRTLYRIRALKSFNDVKLGDLGGFVESEQNLSQEGLCWVYDNAKICDNATVYHNAQVRDNATILDHVIISDHAIITDGSCILNSAYIHGHAKIKDHAMVFKHACIYGYAIVDNFAMISDYAQICGTTHVTDKVHVNGNARILGNAIISKPGDYIVFQNTWSNEKSSFITYTKSNNKWSDGQFYGTGKNLIEELKIVDPNSSNNYKLYVELVEKLKTIQYISVEKKQK